MFAEGSSACCVYSYNKKTVGLPVVNIPSLNSLPTKPNLHTTGCILDHKQGCNTCISCCISTHEHTHRHMHAKNLCRNDHTLM